MNKPVRIPQMEPWFDAAEREALQTYMLGGGWVTEFKETKKFEDELAAFMGARHVVLTNNGTIALSMAMLALGVGPGDEVIVPDLTMIASPNSARMIGAVPVFVDVELPTLNISPAAVAAAFTPRTKAVMHVSFNGRSNDVEKLKALCDARGVALLEDSCQSLGSYLKPGVHLGTVGAIGCLSFSLPKIISTGQGGALLTNDDEIAGRIRRLKDFGRSGGGNDIHHSIGYNFKYTDLQAAVGLAQMKKLPWRVVRKKEIWRRYAAGLAGIRQVEILPTDLNLVAPWFIDVFVEDRDALQAALDKAGIGTRPMYPPIHRQKAYGLDHLTFPVTERYAPRGLWLPSSAQLSDAEIDRVCGAIRAHYA